MLKRDELPNYYSILIPQVRYNAKISDFAKLIYSEITALSSKTGECWATNNYFAKCYSKSKRTIQRAISELLDESLISVVMIRGDNKKNVEKRIIRLLGIDNLDTKRTNNDTRGDDISVIENNINNNNIKNTICDDDIFLKEVEAPKKKDNELFRSANDLIGIWNDFARENNLEIILSPTPIRLKYIKQRLKEELFNLPIILEKLKGNDFWLKKFMNGRGINFDYLISSERYVKLLEVRENKSGTLSDFERLSEKRKERQKLADEYRKRK